MDNSRGQISLGLPTSVTQTRRVARLPVPPTQPSQNPSAICLASGFGVEGSVDERQTFGDFLVLIGSLLEGSEVRAALLLLGNLASSEFADSELPFRQSEFKDHITDFVSTNTPEFSNDAHDFIQHWCDEDYQLDVWSAPDNLSPTVSNTPVSMHSPASTTRRRGWSPARRSPSRSSTSHTSVSLPCEADANPGLLPAVDGPRRSKVCCNDRESLPSPLNSFQLTDFVASRGDDELRGQTRDAYPNEGVETLRPVRGLPSLQTTRRPRTAQKEETRRK